MAWLCVNKNGQELICQNEPERWGDIRKEVSRFGVLDKATGKRYTTEAAREWEIGKLKYEELSYWKDEEIWGCGEYCPNFDIELPEGSIEKLIGKKLTWEDDPVEI